MARLWLHGRAGRMGQEIEKALAENKTHAFTLVGPERPGRPSVPELAEQLRATGAEIVVDFSTPEGSATLAEAIEQSGLRGLSILVGTTGMPSATLDRWRALTPKGGHRTLIAPNTSVGILLLAKTALTAAGVATGLDFDIEVVETHHRMKKDAPSGTARFLAETIAGGVKGLTPIYNQRDGVRERGEIGVHAVRGGGVFGEHEIRIISSNEELTLSHRAFSRALFASGAVTLGKWLHGKAPGVYKLLDVDIADLK